MAATKDLIEIFLENCPVHVVVAEASSHEKRATTPQDGAKHRYVQILASSDVWRHHAFAKQQVGEEQIIEMTAVGRDVDERVIFCNLGDSLVSSQYYPVVDSGPEPVQQLLQDAYGGMGHVRGDGMRYPNRNFLQCESFLRITFRVLLDGRLHRAGRCDLIDQRTSVGQIRP